MRKVQNTVQKSCRASNCRATLHLSVRTAVHLTVRHRKCTAFQWYASAIRCAWSFGVPIPIPLRLPVLHYSALKSTIHFTLGWSGGTYHAYSVPSPQIFFKNSSSEQSYTWYSLSSVCVLCWIAQKSNAAVHLKKNTIHRASLSALNWSTFRTVPNCKFKFLPSRSMTLAEIGAGGFGNTRWYGVIKEELKN
jgi:hypothetical protein